jgi:hypothetical protein
MECHGAFATVTGAGVNFDFVDEHGFFFSLLLLLLPVYFSKLKWSRGMSNGNKKGEARDLAVKFVLREG